MDPDRLARLTEQQRACLRFVFAHMTSKEIAPHLGIAPNSVDQHIKAAMRTLGTSDRRAAARMLAEHEGAAARQPLVYQMPELAPEEDRAVFAKVDEGLRPWPGMAMHDEQAAFEATQARTPLFPLPIGGARPNDVGILKRLAWIALIAIGAALAFGALAAGVEALTRLIRA
jgi:DNA-binding CsgD family transcriptional regulator